MNQKEKMKNNPLKIFRAFSLISWAVLFLYYTTFQLIAVRLHPKIIIDADPSKVDKFLSSPLGRFREFMKPVWLKNGPILIVLLLVSLILTATWLYFKNIINSDHHENI